MASQQTPNYKLSRWAGTDRILMEEFNADNEKIDEILGAHAKALEKLVPMTVLHDETLTESKSSIKIDVRKEGWANYHIVLLTYTPPKEGKFGTLSIAFGEEPVFSAGDHCDIFYMERGMKKHLAETNSSYGFSMVFLSGKDGGRFVQTIASVAGAIQFGRSTTGYDYENHPLWIFADNGEIPAGAQIRAVGLF